MKAIVTLVASPRSSADALLHLRPDAAPLALGALLLALLPWLAGCAPAPSDASTAGTEGLRPVAHFDSIEDDDARAVALFEEAARVLTHPRCVNCHPSGDAPLQGETGEPHQPNARRGSNGLGVVGMRCDTCHHEENYDPGRVPGAPHWRLAPIKMAWEDLSLGEICRQLKDPARNGNRDLAAIEKHMKEDALVAWGWEPGIDREPAPGSQDAFADLIEAWIDAGAACPDA